MEFVPLLAAAALVWKIVDFLKYLRTGDVNGVFTQLSVWVAGVAVVLLLANTDWADGITVGDTILGALNGASLVLLGLSVGSTSSVLYDTKAAIDGSDTAVKPPLITG